jgi:hypothetical protein
MKPDKKRLFSGLVLAATLMVVILPWGVRNQISMGKFMIFETRGANVFYGELTTKQSIPKRFDTMQGITEIERWEEQKEWLYELILSDPAILIRQAVIHLRWSLFPIKLYRLHSWLIIVDISILLAALGGVFAVRKRWKEILPILLFIFLYFSSVLLLLKGSEARFRLTLDSLIFIFIAISCYNVINYMHKIILEKTKKIN